MDSSEAVHSTSLSSQVWNFIIHLRLHYQLFILSGGFLLAALFVTDIRWSQFILQFLNVHVLLFGGATAYNSFWDKDEGPVGGLKFPPEMKPWMWTASLVIQYAGLVWAMSIGLKYFVIYACSMLLFWLYSTPMARWKGRPWLSIFAIGGSTGTNSFLLGYLAAGGEYLEAREGMIAFGVAFIMLSLYPVSQVYQLEEDTKRGDKTFAMKYGLKGVRLLYGLLFISGAAIISFFLYHENELAGLLFGAVSLFAYVVIFLMLAKLKAEQKEYNLVMRIKFFASFSFVFFILSVLILNSLF